MKKAWARLKHEIHRYKITLLSTWLIEALDPLNENDYKLIKQISEYARNDV